MVELKIVNRKLSALGLFDGPDRLGAEAAEAVPLPGVELSPPIYDSQFTTERST
jgi:hypothetical protein